MTSEPVLCVRLAQLLWRGAGCFSVPASFEWLQIGDFDWDAEADLDTLLGLVIVLTFCLVTVLNGLGVSSFYSRESHVKVGYSASYYNTSSVLSSNG